MTPNPPSGSRRTARADSALRRLARNPMAVGAVLVLALLVLASLFAPLISGQDPNLGAIRDTMLPPGTQGHPLGTDSAGRDVLARMLYGGRTSLLGALLALSVAALIGIPTGLLAGYYGRWFDSGSIWWNNLVQSMPGLVVLLAVRAVMGPSIWISMTVYGVILSPGFFRVVRTSVVNVRNELYVDAARVSGLSDLAIIGRHILTVVRAPAIIQGSLLAGIALAIQSGLEFLGVGDNTVPSWGNILNEAFRNIYRTPVMLLWPSLAIGLTCAALVLLGNGLRDALEDRGAGTGRARGRRRPAPAVPAAPVALVAEPAPVPADVVAEPSLLPAATPAPPPEPDPQALLSVRNLSIGYGRDDALKVVVHDVALQIREGEVLGLVGESGSGKTQTAFSVLGLLPEGGRVLSGSIRFSGTELTEQSQSQMRRLRGSGISYIPQEPMSNLDPSFRIGSQLTSPMRRKLGIGRREARERALALLERVGITDPQRTFDAFPHQISGGMAQRVLIAGAVSCQPRLLIADEPTTALDVTVQAEVLGLLRDLQGEFKMGVILVTHNFGVVADLCDRVAVMQDGTIVETADAEKIFGSPQHPYTQMLLDSTLEGAPSRVQLDAARKATV